MSKTDTGLGCSEMLLLELRDYRVMMRITTSYTLLDKRGTRLSGHPDLAKILQEVKARREGKWPPADSTHEKE